MQFFKIHLVPLLLHKLHTIQHEHFFHCLYIAVEIIFKTSFQYILHSVKYWLTRQRLEQKKTIALPT